MKLLLYDKFWDSFLRLNKATQKKVVEFQQKFRTDSRSAAIHLEPISTFKDQSLRTARIDQKYRAIIKVPDTGNAYYLMWVDNHDEAMDWARNKVISWNESTQALQVFTVPEEEVLPLENATPNNTQEPATGLAMYGDEALLKLGVPEVLLPSTRTIRHIDDLEKMEPYLPTPVFETLFYLLDGADIELLLSEIQEGTVDSDNPDDTAGSVNNQRSFIELTDDELFNEALSGNLDKWKYYLHPSQRKLVTGQFNGPVKITGGAGTGKTVAALHRLKFLSEQATVDAPVLFTTFTKALTQNLRELAANLRIPSERILITHIDALAFDLATKYHLIGSETKIFEWSSVKKSEEVWEDLMEEKVVGYDKEFLEQEFRQVILYHNVQDLPTYLRVLRTGRGTTLSRRQRAEVWAIMEDYRAKIAQINTLHKEDVYNQVVLYLNDQGIRPYSFVIVDELQDFSNVELRFIRALVAEKANDMFCVGDPLQAIYNKRINFSQAGINVRGKRSRRLRINYRTTEEIKKLAVSIISDSHYDNFDGEAEEKKGYVSLFHGQKPTYQLFRTKSEEVDAVLQSIEMLTDAGYQYSDIAVAARTKTGLKDITDALHMKKVPYFESHSDKRSGEQSGIRVMTFHGIKGLEFKHVILVDVNSRTAPKLFQGFSDKEAEFQEQYLISEKSLLYVAASRAIASLSIMGTGAASEMISI